MTLSGRWPRSYPGKARRLRDAGVPYIEIAARLEVPYGTLVPWLRSREARERRLQYYREHNAIAQRPGHMYLGIVEQCPSCGTRGYVYLRWQVQVKSSHRAFTWDVSHRPGLEGKYERHCVFALRLWAGTRILFTSPIREAGFRKLVGVA